jgi:hypothetical protein
MSSAEERVNELIATQKNFAEASFATANSAIEELSSMSVPYTIYGTVDTTFTGKDMVAPSNPGDVAIRPDPTGLFKVSIDPVMPEKPDLTVENPPDIDWSKIAQVTAPVVSSKTITFPVSKMDAITLGALKDYIIPDAPAITYPTYSVEPPTLLTISPIQHQFSIDEIEILDDELVTVIKNRLINNIRYGGTGLLPAIEDAIWNRDLERNEQQLEDSTDKLVQVWAKKGFTLPDGMLAHSLAEIQKDYQNKLLDRSREIAIKQAELEQTNIFKSMEIGINLIAELIKSLIDYDRLVLQMQEDIAKFANEYINAQIAVNNSSIEIFKAKISAYGEIMRAEVAKIEVYRAQVQAALGVLQLNDQQIKIYTARIEAEIARYNGELQGNKLIVEIFSEEVRGILAQVGLEDAKMKAYAEQVRAVLARADVYKTELEAVITEVNVEKVKLESNMQTIQQWAKKVDVDIARYNARLEEYKANIELNKAIAVVANSVNDSEVRAWTASANANIAYAKLEEESISGKYAMQLEAQKAVASIAGNIAAGAMSAVNAGANLEYAEQKTTS